MTNYIVHLYREMRLTFEGIEADTSEAAAAIACDKPTGDADDIEDCEGETLSALVDVAGDEQFGQSRFIDFDTEKQRKAAPALLAALKAILPYAENEHASLFECWKRDRETNAGAESEACGRAIDLATTAIAVAAAGGMTPASADAGTLPWETTYSVLLLYPDYANDGGHETYYAFVTASDPLEAVAVAQRQAVAAQEGVDIDPEDFHPLLVTQGHHCGEPLFNK